jgi:V/A-type H+-transporting ATPase subunit D
MERLRVPATKSNLLRLKEELTFAREGKSLLTQKREVLVLEMLRLQDDAQRVRTELDGLLANAYEAFAAAAMLEGYDAMERLALAVPAEPEVKVDERSVMGVVLPIVRGQARPWQPTYGLATGSSASDRAGALFHEVGRCLCEAAEIETAIYRLAMETRKTIRRERALENLFIPQYHETVKFIQESLEEKDRESFYQLKILKGGREQ